MIGGLESGLLYENLTTQKGFCIVNQSKIRIYMVNITMNAQNFQKVLGIAEFAAKRMEERRSAEFRIFISYMTLLILAFYQIVKANVIDISFICDGLMLISISVGIHFLYCALQVGISIAMRYDAIRRNYYLRKAEDISGYPPNYYPDNPESGEEDMDKIYRIKHFGKLFSPSSLKVFYKNWSCIPLIFIPTLSFVIVIGFLWHKSGW